MRKAQVSVSNMIILLFFVLLPCCSTIRHKGETINTDRKQVKILSYNVRNARGMDEIIDYDRVADVIRRIDANCVAVQELDSATQRSGGLIALNELAKRTGMFATYNKSIDYQGGGYGIGILTKEKPLRKDAIELPGSEEQRSLLLVEMVDYIICCTHWSLKQPDRRASVDIINELMQNYRSKPIFLAGDLNAVPDSEEIQELSKEWTFLNDTSQPTIPVNNPKRCIDYILAKKNPKLAFTVLETRVENETMASDHLPVWVSVSITSNN